MRLLSRHEFVSAQNYAEDMVTPLTANVCIARRAALNTTISFCHSFHSLQLSLPDCVRFSCCSPIASALAAAPRLHPLQLSFPDCAHFSSSFKIERLNRQIQTLKLEIRKIAKFISHQIFLLYSRCKYTTLHQSVVLPTRQYYVSSSATVTDRGQGLAEGKLIDLNSHLHVCACLLGPTTYCKSLPALILRICIMHYFKNDSRAKRAVSDLNLFSG